VRRGTWRGLSIGVVFLAAICTAIPGQALRNTDPPDLCHLAATRASQQTGVPLPVLMAIALTESGRKTGDRFAPWPWTMNIAGEGRFFDGRAAALAHARATLSGGETSFDMGCFQVNYRWHGAAFPSLEAMLDPDRNALYAARFLSDLHGESGDWAIAAGHYHSRTPVHANRYRKVFTRHLAALSTDDLSAPRAAPEPPAVTRQNGYSLLRPGGPPAAMGSLVPVHEGRGGLLGGAARALWGG